MKGEPKEAIVDTAEIRDVGFALSRSDAIEREYFIHTQSRESTTAIGSAPLGGCPCMLVIADGSLPSVDKTLSRRSGSGFCRHMPIRSQEMAESLAVLRE